MIDLLRQVRDVFHISGFLVLNALRQIVQIVLNQAAPLANLFVDLLLVLLAPAHIAINLVKTWVTNFPLADTVDYLSILL